MLLVYYLGRTVLFLSYMGYPNPICCLSVVCVCVSGSSVGRNRNWETAIGFIYPPVMLGRYEIKIHDYTSIVLVIPCILQNTNSTK